MVEIIYNSFAVVLLPEMEWYSYRKEFAPFQGANSFLNECHPRSMEKRRYSHTLDKNIPFYRCLRFIYPGLLSQPRL